MDMDTTMFIASFTKLVTIISCMQLVEQGKFDLDDPECVKKYAPEIGKKKVYPDGVTPVDQERPVTLRMLLSHTAGFAYAFLDPRPTIHTRPLGISEFSGEVQEYIDSPMVNQPGSMWEYSVSSSPAGWLKNRLTNPMSNIPDQHRLGRHHARARLERKTKRLLQRAHLQASGHRARDHVPYERDACQSCVYACAG
jgi:hypothetical protein